MEEGHGGTLINWTKEVLVQSENPLLALQKHKRVYVIYEGRVWIDRSLSLDKHFSFHQPQMFVSNTKYSQNKNKNQIFLFVTVFKSHSVGEGKINFEEY